MLFITERSLTTKALKGFARFKFHKGSCNWLREPLCVLCAFCGKKDEMLIT